VTTGHVQRSQALARPQDDQERPAGAVDGGRDAPPGGCDRLGAAW
jgi:hypothetical protein